MGKLEVKTEMNGDLAKVKIDGVIDEDIDFAKHPLTTAKRVEMNFAGVQGISSSGVVGWIKWLSTATQAQLTYLNCPKVIVDQINMVKGFLPVNGKVDSFYVPYYSEVNGTEQNILFVRGREFSDSVLTSPPEVRDQAGNIMDMDVVEAKYFKFLKPG